MKKLLLLAICACFSMNLNAQSTPIPDPNFEQELVTQGIDSDGLNGQILNSDASSVLILSLHNKNISDLSGIEAFSSLEVLLCSGNNLSVLDLTSNTTLVGLYAYDNQLTSTGLNLTGLTGLESIDLSDNNLSDLDFTPHPALEELYLYDNNIDALTIHNNVNMVELSCGDNMITDQLDVSNMPNLEFLSCSNNQLTGVGIILGNHPNLYGIVCGANQITNMDCSGLPSLEELVCGQNQLVSLNVKNGNNTNFTAFNSIGNPDLNCIEVDDPAYSSAATATWEKDLLASYNTNCGTVSVEESLHTSSPTLHVFPNPSNGQFTLDVSEPGPYSTTVSDALGRVILQREGDFGQHAFDLSPFPAGTYFIQVVQNNETASLRLFFRH